jgi:hypothetical protein
MSVFNNLEYSLATTTDQYDMFISRTGPFVGTSDYNLIFGKVWSASTSPLFGYYPNIGLAAWQSQSSQDKHSLFADPGIGVTDPLATGFAQPAAGGAGVNVAIVTGNWADARGRIRDATPDIGALELVH